MIIPVRCFTCGRIIGSDYERFIERVEGGEKPKEVLDSLGVERLCCRRMILSHVDLIDKVAAYE